MNQDLTKSLERQILKDILAAGEVGVYVYTFPAKYKIRISDVFPFLESHRSWLEYKSGRVRVFSYAKRALQGAVGQSGKKDDESGDDCIPLVFQGEKIKVDDFCLPTNKFYIQLQRQKRKEGD